MKLFKLAGYFALKYKIASSPEDAEGDVRKGIDMLWRFANELFVILSICAEAGVTDPKNAYEKKAQAGHLFCKELLSRINYLGKKQNTSELGEIREVVGQIGKLIEQNKDIKFNSEGKIDNKADLSPVQFQHVSALISLIPTPRKSDKTLRDQQYSKAKTGLARILSKSIEIMKYLRQLEIMVPEKFKYENVTDLDINSPLPERFSPQRTMLSEHDIVDFINQYGNDFGISSKDDWEIVFNNNPELRNTMTTVINALNRGHYPKDASYVKEQIEDILSTYKERRLNNNEIFENPELEFKNKQLEIAQRRQREKDRLEKSKSHLYDPAFVAKQHESMVRHEEMMERNKDLDREESEREDLINKYNSLSFSDWLKKGK
tara:strand:- start:8075 stop:9202 length:1128 start_codon:yes stop_codon:yes gene_type:complete